MINYTERVTDLMQDIALRTPALAHVDMSEVLVFARFGRSDADGAFATCHCLTLPTSEPGYYFWRDRRTGKVTRRSEWFVTKSPEVRLGKKRIKYLVSFALPRFCDQSLEKSRKKENYPDAEPWLAKLDTIVHELYHIDPNETGIRRINRADGSHSPRSHGRGFYEQVATMVKEYLANGSDPARYDFLRFTFSDLHHQYGGVTGTTFRNFPSFPQRYVEPLREQPDGPIVKIETVKPPNQPCVYTADDLLIHQFLATSAKRVAGNGNRPPASSNH